MEEERVTDVSDVSGTHSECDTFLDVLYIFASVILELQVYWSIDSLIDYSCLNLLQYSILIINFIYWVGILFKIKMVYLIFLLF